jgi:hypothetical protein
MPFHQPLQLLASIKFEMDGHSSDENRKMHAAYFAEDYETNQRYRAKDSKLQDKTSKSSATESTSKKSNNTEELVDKPVETINEIAEENVSITDSITEIDEAEIIENDSKSKEVKIVNSILADETLEDEVILELLEEKLDVDIQSISVVDPEINQTKEIVPEIEKENVEDAIESDNLGDHEDIESDIELETTNSGVDYSAFKLIDSKVDSLKDDDLEEDTTSSLDYRNLDHILEENSKKKKVKNKKAKSKKKNEKELDEHKLKEKKKKKDKKKDKKSKKKREKKQKNKKKRGSKKNSNILKTKSTKTKKKANKSNKKVAHVIVNATNEKLTGTKDYDGVSSYTSWLLEQESINGQDPSQKKATNKVKKSKKKKKKKKSKKLKIAVDSIKKQDSIMSEPLANILAVQGHKKKAKKMYKKLAKAYPDKKDYFKEKINLLNKEDNKA